MFLFIIRLSFTYSLESYIKILVLFSASFLFIKGARDWFRAAKLKGIIKESRETKMSKHPLN